jgi:hypothetical protein
MVRAADRSGARLWKDVIDRLNAPTSAAWLDGILVLALRHRGDAFDGRLFSRNWTSRESRA